MLQRLYKGLDQDVFTVDIAPKPIEFIEDLESYNEQEGLALSAEEIEYLENMKKNGYSRWKARLKYMLSLFDGVRIDHFRAISAYWSIPIGAKTAKEGRFEKGPANELIDAFREVSDGKLILAENFEQKFMITPSNKKRLVVSFNNLPAELQEKV